MTNDQETVAWVVSAGDYSDYRVLCVCPSKADAEEVARKINTAKEDSRWWYGDASVESLPIIDAEMAMVTHETITTTLWDDGRETAATSRQEITYPLGGDYPRVAWRWVRAPCHQGRGGRLDVHGIDVERVRKVFSERRAELLANPHLRMSDELEGRVQ